MAWAQQGAMNVHWPSGEFGHEKMSEQPWELQPLQEGSGPPALVQSSGIGGGGLFGGGGLSGGGGASGGGGLSGGSGLAGGNGSGGGLGGLSCIRFRPTRTLRREGAAWWAAAA